jgi:hypothetical protein
MELKQHLINNEVLDVKDTAFNDKRYINVTGDTATGPLTINTNSTNALLVEQDGVKDNVLVVDTTNGRVGINKAPTLGALDITGGVFSTSQNKIDGTSDQIQLIVQGHSTQTANLQEWQNSSGTVLACITGTGSVGIGINPPIYKLDIAAGTGSHFIRLKTTTDNQTGIILGTSTYNWSFGVHGGGSGTLKLSTTAGDVTASPVLQIATNGDQTIVGRSYLTKTLTNTTAGNGATNSYLTTVFTATSANSTAAGVFDNAFTGSANHTGVLIGVTGRAYNASTFSTNIIAGLSFAVGSTSSGNITEAIGVNIKGLSTSTGLITNLKYYTIQADATFAPTTAPTNIYGLYLPNITAGATLNYAIYTNAGKVRIGDDLIFETAGSGLSYGSMGGDDLAIAVVVAAADTYYAVGTGLTVGLLNNFTFSASTLTCLVAGNYKVDWSMALSAGNNDHLEGVVMVNSTVNHLTACSAHTPGNGDEIGVSGTGIITLAVNDVVKLAVENEIDADDITVHTASLSIVQVGA